MAEVLVGRQPIFDKKLNVYAYELLFRGKGIDPEDPDHGDMATSQVIVNAFTAIGFERLVSDRRAFINLTRSFITGEYPLPFAPSNVVLEVLESVAADDDVVAGLARLRDSGFTIALDDFVLGPDTEGLMQFAHLVKLDVLDKSDAQVQAEVDALRPYGVELLAEKVETREQFEACKAMGFTYFQGFFLERPSEVSARAVHPGELTLLTLLHELHSPAFNFTRAQEIVEQDVALCYRFLRHINSVLFGIRREIKSVREVLVYLGIENVQNLTSLFLLASNKDTPGEVIRAAMVRARMCESFGRAKKDPDHQMYFMVGLFSTLDAIMQVPMDDLLGKLPLSDVQKAALSDGAGDMGEALSAARAYEHGDWDNVACFGLSADRILKIYLDALSWAQVVSEDDVRGAA